MKFNKFILVPAVLLSLVSCSTSKNTFNEKYKSASLSFFEKKAYDSDYVVEARNYKKIDLSVDLKDYPTNVYYSPFYLKENDDSTYNLFSIAANKILATNVVSDSIYNCSTIVRSITSNLCVYGTYDSTKELYNYHLVDSFGNDIYNYISKDETSINSNVQYGYSNNEMYIKIDFEGTKYESKYFKYDYKTKLFSDLDKEYKAEMYASFDSNGKVIYYSKYINNSFYIYDKKGNYLHQLSLSFINNLSDFDSIEYDSKVFYYRTYDYYDNYLTKPSYTTYKTEGYMVDYLKGTIEYYDSLPFIIDGYSFDEKDDYGSYSVSVNFYLLDEKGKKEEVLLANEFKGNLDFTSNYYLYDDFCSATIYKLAKNTYLASTNSGLYYIDGKNRIPLSKLEYVTYFTSNYVILRDNLQNSVYFNKSTFYEEYKNYKISDNKTLELYNPATKSKSSVVYDPINSNYVLDSKYTIESSGLNYLEYYNLIVSNGKITDFFGNVLATLESNENLASVTSLYMDKVIVLNIKNASDLTVRNVALKY